MLRFFKTNLNIINYKANYIRFFSISTSDNAKVALVLSGCGVYDGSEIHEASSTLIHLSRAKADVSIFAPDIQQMHVVDHIKGTPIENESRNVLIESARIARGNIQSLDQLKVSVFDAIVFPGGFGAAKNLSDFAANGVNLKVNEDVSRIIKEFHANKKPIGLCCIAPVLVAKVLKGCEVTVGHDKEENGKWPFASTAAAIQELGSIHINKEVDEVHVDKKNLIVTTPAFMAGSAPIYEIYDGIGLMISKLIQLIQKKHK